MKISFLIKLNITFSLALIFLSFEFERYQSGRTGYFINLIGSIVFLVIIKKFESKKGNEDGGRQNNDKKTKM